MVINRPPPEIAEQIGVRRGGNSQSIHDYCAEQAKAREAAASSPEAQRENFDTLRLLFLKSGASVPGLSFKGLPAVQQESQPRYIEIAQRRINEFCSVLSGDEQAQRLKATARQRHAT